jgi:hypothetical protein
VSPGLAPDDEPLDRAIAAELRRLVGEVLAEVLPGLRGNGGQAPAGPVPSSPRVAQVDALAAGGIPSGVPAGPPSAMSAGPGGVMNGPSIPVFPDEWSIHRGSGVQADRGRRLRNELSC